MKNWLSYKFIALNLDDSDIVVNLLGLLNDLFEMEAKKLSGTELGVIKWDNSEDFVIGQSALGQSLYS